MKAVLLPTGIMSWKIRSTFSKIGIGIAVTLFALWIVLPLAWLISTSLKGTLEVYNSRNFFPIAPSLNSFRAVLSESSFWTSLVNSLYVSFSSTIIALGICIFAAYGFARYLTKWKHILLLFILVPRVIPRISLVIPLYDLIVSVGLLNTYSALIITYTATAIPLGTWILIGFFEAIPKEMEECASLDGASLFTILWKIMVPIAWPGIMTVFILTLREGWNEFPFALAFTTDRTMRTLPYQLFLLRDTLGLEDWSIVSAFTILTIIPILVLFLVFQKHVVKSIMSGAMKS